MPLSPESWHEEPYHIADVLLEVEPRACASTETLYRASYIPAPALFSFLQPRSFSLFHIKPQTHRERTSMSMSTVLRYRSLCCLFVAIISFTSSGDYLLSSLCASCVQDAHNSDMKKRLYVYQCWSGAQDKPSPHSLKGREKDSLQLKIL